MISSHCHWPSPVKIMKLLKVEGAQHVYHASVKVDGRHRKEATLGECPQPRCKQHLGVLVAVGVMDRHQEDGDASAVVLREVD